MNSPQTEQRFGFPTVFRNSPVCFFWCLVRFDLSTNDILQSLQACGFIALWIFM